MQMAGELDRAHQAEELQSVGHLGQAGAEVAEEAVQPHPSPGLADCCHIVHGLHSSAVTILLSISGTCTGLPCCPRPLASVAGVPTAGQS